MHDAERRKPDEIKYTKLCLSTGNIMLRSCKSSSQAKPRTTAQPWPLVGVWVGLCANAANDDVSQSTDLQTDQSSNAM